MVNQATDAEGNTPQDLLCMVCQVTINDPVKCSNPKCEELFCQQCISNWLRNDNSCPNCQGKYGIEPLGRKLKSLINCKMVRCKCEQTMSYEELVGKHIYECIRKQIECPLGCSKILVSKVDAVMHYDICMQAMVACEWCSAKVKRADLFAHQQSCPEGTETCHNCQMAYKRKDAQTHLDSCLEIDIECPECKAEIKRRDISAHKMSCPMLTLHCVRCSGAFIRKNEGLHDCVKYQNEVISR